MGVASDPGAETFYTRLGARRVGTDPAPMPGAPDRILPVLQWDGLSLGSLHLSSVKDDRGCLGELPEDIGAAAKPTSGRIPPT